MSPKIPLQSRFPQAWLLFQYVAAGYFGRGRRIRAHYHGQRRVLEIGCSLGLDSRHFANKDCEFLGLDIDPDAVAVANRTYAKRPHMRFVCMDVHDLHPAPEDRFDLILVSGVCHHLPDAPLTALLEQAGRLLADDGRLALIDYAPPERPGLLERFFLRFDDGQHIRSREALLALLRAVPNLEIDRLEIFRNPAFVFPWPIMAHKFSIAMKARGAGAAAS